LIAKEAAETAALRASVLGATLYNSPMLRGAPASESPVRGWLTARHSLWWKRYAWLAVGYAVILGLALRGQLLLDNSPGNLDTLSDIIEAFSGIQMGGAALYLPITAIHASALAVALHTIQFALPAPNTLSVVEPRDIQRELLRFVRMVSFGWVGLACILPFGLVIQYDSSRSGFDFYNPVTGWPTLMPQFACGLLAAELATTVIFEVRNRSFKVLFTVPLLLLAGKLMSLIFDGMQDILNMSFSNLFPLQGSLSTAAFIFDDFAATLVCLVSYVAVALFNNRWSGRRMRQLAALLATGNASVEQALAAK